jgi:hypothetical protein
MRSRARWRVALAKEQRWIAEYVPTPPALRARDLIRGEAYVAVWRHDPGCMIFAGYRCECKPDIKFFAARTRREDNDLDSLDHAA